MAAVKTKANVPLPVVHETCPHCEGLVPSDAITYGPIAHGGDAWGPYLTQKVTLRCPHCLEVSTRENTKRTGN